MQTYSKNYSNSYKCQLQEKKGRTIGAMCLNEIFEPYKDNMVLTGTALTCPVDIKGSITLTEKNVNFNVEVKQRYKTEKQLAEYPKCELRVDKYQRMLEETPKGTTLLYMVLLNGTTCYLFNLSKINMNELNIVDWYVKETEVDSDSTYKNFPIYQIPTELAIKTIDCSEYFKKWNYQYANN